MAITDRPSPTVEQRRWSLWRAMVWPRREAVPRRTARVPWIPIVIISVIVMINHCYFGYNASGGPVGVGEAVGKSMRSSLVLIQFVVLFASLALYGTDPNFNLTV